MIDTDTKHVTVGIHGEGSVDPVESSAAATTMHTESAAFFSEETRVRRELPLYLLLKTKAR